MFNVSFRSSCFSDPANRHRDERVLEKLLDALVEADLAYLAARPRTPPLYKAGVIYIGEPPGIEIFADIGHVLENHGGDCEDLVCWRVAELRHYNADRRAKPLLRIFPRACRSTEGEPCVLYHVQVLRGDGRIEDPSALLGMPTPQWFQPTAVPRSIVR